MIKTNNSNLSLKVDLRRQVLKAGQFKTLRVLDLFAGKGEIWAQLRQEFKVESYMPCDVRPQMPGTLKANVTPLFVEAIASDKINVVDVDTYGEPWEIWASVANRIRQPAAVFLTHGVVAMGQTSHYALESMGIPREWKVPVKPQLSQFAARFFIIPEFHQLRLERAWSASAGHATHYGLLVTPSAGPEVAIPQ